MSIITFPAGIGVNGTIDSVQILDSAGVATQVLDSTQDYTVQVDWTVNGAAVGNTFGGTWSVQLYVESMGDGYEGDLGPAQPQLVTALSANSEKITVSAATLQAKLMQPAPAPGDRRVFKLVALVSHELFGLTKMIAGFGEGPFFEVR